MNVNAHVLYANEQMHFILLMNLYSICIQMEKTYPESIHDLPLGKVGVLFFNYLCVFGLVEKGK